MKIVHDSIGCFMNAQPSMAQLLGDAQPQYTHTVNLKFRFIVVATSNFNLYSLSLIQRFSELCIVLTLSLRSFLHHGLHSSRYSWLPDNPFSHHLVGCCIIFCPLHKICLLPQSNDHRWLYYIWNIGLLCRYLRNSYMFQCHRRVRVQ